jgi:uncharacterized protein
LCGSKSMSDRPKRQGIFGGSGPLIALVTAAGVLLGSGPTSAHFFNFGGFQQRSQPQRGGGWFGNDQFEPFRPPAPQPRREKLPPIREDFSKAPPPEKRETVPQRLILVLGDSMADWLAYGLEDAYSEQPDIGVIRKHKTVSGLIRYQPKREPADWVAAARRILATEKADVIVVMLGLSDRISMHEPAPEKVDSKSADKKVDKKVEKDATSKPESNPRAAPEDKPSDYELSGDAAGPELPVVAPDKRARSPNGVYEFRDERWVELYNNKIDEMIGVLRSNGVPVLWVGLPAVRGPTATADTLFLDALYRDAASKAGITYLDVWNGFVDQDGRFLQKGPGFEGQIRQLRSSDGVYFTKAGARKLAHYAEREITRLLAARSIPIALPTEPATPDATAIPGQPVRRPLVGTVVPLESRSVVTDQLLGGPGSPPAAVDALAARTLTKCEALTPTPGRADDFAWPRREVGGEQAKPTNPMASASPDALGDASTIATKPSARPDWRVRNLRASQHSVARN